MIQKFLTAFALVLIACTASFAQKAEQPILSVDGTAYYPRDFFNPYFEAYLRAEDKSALTPEKFLDTFIDNAIKLKQAKAQGIDTLQAIRSAVDNYIKLYTASYQYDAPALERLSKEAASRAKEDIRVSHILIPVSPFAFEKDSLAAKARIDSVYAALKAGTPFDTLARKINGPGSDGDLGFVTVFQLPYPLETAAYNTPAGSFSQPVRTDLGYHIVRPTERRPAYGLVELAYIMVMRKGSDSLDRKSLADIREAYSKLKSGEKFENVALNYTEDANTQANGGYLGFYGIGELIPEIEKLVFSLEPGQTTSIIATPDCWEIIKVISKVQNDNYDTRKDFLQNRVIGDSRYLPFLRTYAKEKLSSYPLKVNEEQYGKVLESLSNMGFLYGEWKSEQARNTTEELFTLNGKAFTAGDFYNSLFYGMTDYGQQAELRQVVKSKFDDFVANTALDMYVKNLPATDAKVKSAVEDFRNKSVIYTLMNQYCQEQLLNVDPDTLLAVYHRDSSRYMWKERVRYEAIVCQDLAVAQQARQMMLQGISYLEILSALNKGLVRTADGYQATEVPEKAFKSDFIVKQGVADIIQEDDNYFLFNVLEILPPSLKTFDQALAEVKEDYLRLCAERYTAQLRKSHDVQVFKKEMKALDKAVAAQKKARGIQ